MDNLTAIRPAKSDPETFDALSDRFMSFRSRFEILKDILGDCANVPNELAPAAYVFNETVKDVLRFHSDLESWHMAHEHTAKASKAAQP